ncbi:DNA metabolism protein [Lithospermum erythrorhizon]|uniref:Replication protein A subunit n=1 Tax=Lithospermum erythrorhizon TaxID=34254 RepID=A0AAV3QBR0_LITER
MSNNVTHNAISTILANPSPNTCSDLPDLIVQVLDLKPLGNKFMFTASDGKMKLKAMLHSTLSSEVISGKIQNLGLIGLSDYIVNDIPNKSEKWLIVSKCEAVSPALEKEYSTEAKVEDSGSVLKPHQGDAVMKDVKPEICGIVVKPKKEIVAKSAAQIVHEQNGNNMPSARMAMTRRIQPLVSLNPYQGNWTIKVRVTNKGIMRTYKNARGEGCVFNVELTDEDGTQIQATMFNEAAKKFFDKFQLGKVYYISKGSLRVANKQFKTVQNDYEMTLNENSVVEEASEEASFVPEIKYNFVPIDELGPYVGGRELVDVIGVVQNVSPTMSIRRKSDNEMIPKRDITIADDTKKTVVVSLWNDLATDAAQELLEMADQFPVVAIKSVKVGDFQGISLSTISRSSLKINPDLPEAKKLKTWYNSEGKDTSLDSVGAGLATLGKGGAQSYFTDRVFISHIIKNPSLGDDRKPAFFSIKAYISFIKPDQTMWYRACKTCNKKVTEAVGSGYFCEACEKTEEECNLRYIVSLKVTDASGEAWLSVFNDQAEKIIGCSADDLDKLKSQEGESAFQMKLKEATWAPYFFRVSVMPHEYNGDKRQRITARAVGPIDYAAEAKYMLEELSKMKVSQ